MKSSRYIFNFPTLIHFGPGVIHELPSFLKEQKIHRPLIVTDPVLAGLPFLKTLVEGLQNAGLHTEIFSAIHKNPVKSDVVGGVALFHQVKADALVGVGGGASLDVARAIALKAHHPGDLFDYEDGKGGEKLIQHEIPFFVTIPTTSGTGSEVGRSTVIADDQTHEKKILFSPRLMARAVFADPELTLGLPPAVTAATGIDALTHHIEAFLSKGFHPLCDGIALEGIRLISQNLEKCVNKPDLESRTQMMMAALMGGVAFQKGLGVVHSTAHPLSTLFDLHHGLANAIMIPHGIEFNASVSEERLKRIAQVLVLKEQSSAGVVQYLKDLVKSLHLPSTLASQGVKASDLEALSFLALADVCHACNPRPVTLEDFREIYRKAL